MQPNLMSKERDRFIDVLRGVAIFDMILVHYAGNFPGWISKLIVYHDVAMEGFLLLSGIVVGLHYLPQFVENRREAGRKIYLRTFKLLLIQYIMIITVSLPEVLLRNGEVHCQEMTMFLLRSFTFVNQIGLIHILPTFIPLFILTPLFLYLLSRNSDWILFLGSAAIFLIAQKNPYIFDYDDRTTFPVVLWQIYFVGGCCLGKMALRRGSSLPKNPLQLFAISLGLITAGLFARHSTSLCPCITTVMERHSIAIQRFPLNAYGLVWGLTLWLFIYSTIALLWPATKNTGVAAFLALLGRNSLMTFVLHVYFAKTISVIHFLFGSNRVVGYVGILMNIGITYYLLLKYEQAKKEGGRGYVFRTAAWFVK
jgi:hypothetical protein